MGFQKLKPKIIGYQDYKNFNNSKFRHEIVTSTSNIENLCMNKSTIFKVFKCHVIEIYSWNTEPILTKETTASKEISIKNFLKTLTNLIL